MSLRCIGLSGEKVVANHDTETLARLGVGLGILGCIGTGVSLYRSNEDAKALEDMASKVAAASKDAAAALQGVSEVRKDLAALKDAAKATDAQLKEIMASVTAIQASLQPAGNAGAKAPAAPPAARTASAP